MATPRDLDKSFKDESPVEETQIVHRVQTIDANGEATEVVHGPMPRSKWVEYERENKL